MRRELRSVGFLLYNCAILCTVFGAAEFAARTIQFRRFGSNSQQPEALRDRWAAIRNNPAYGRPGVVHNAQGFRRAENVEVVKSVNTVRIFLLGGSVTYGGEGLYPEIESRAAPGNDETIDYYLERRLKREFPSKRWQVINAGVKGYLLNQDLALLLSTVLRYQPDYVVSLDGVNDVSSLLRAPFLYDSYLQPELIQDFNRLANPSSLASLRAMTAAWLRNNSVLFYSMQNALSNWSRQRGRAARARGSEAPSPLQFSDLTAQGQEQYRTSAGQLESLLRPVRLMHAVLVEERIQGLFALAARNTIESQTVDRKRTAIDGVPPKNGKPACSFMVSKPSILSLAHACARTPVREATASSILRRSSTAGRFKVTPITAI